jgi:hypothetical protein
MAGDQPRRREFNMRRKSFSPWTRYPSLALLYAVLVPIAKLAEKAGIWTRPHKGAARRREIYGNFGDYPPTPHDVFACVYFKSGTNWLMQIALQTIHRGAARFEHVHDVVPWPDSPARAYAVPLTDEAAWRNCPTGYRVIKTHLDSAKVPFSPEAHYICVVRDPKDVCVSAYLFLRAEVLGPMMPSVENFVHYFLSASFQFSPWAVYVNGYWRMRDRDNVLFMTYEEMRQDLAAAVRRIGALLGIDLTQQEIDSVVRQSSFDHMKSIEHKFETGMIVPWAKPQGAMIRRGRVRGSSELLTPPLQRRIDDHFRAELKRLGCDFPYDEAFGSPSRGDG